MSGEAVFRELWLEYAELWHDRLPVAPAHLRDFYEASLWMCLLHWAGQVEVL